MGDAIEIVPGDSREPDLAALLAASAALLEATHDTDSLQGRAAAALDDPGMRLFAARAGGQALGIGALLPRPGYGEVRAMYVQPGARGSGVAALLLARIETEARMLGLPVLRLETDEALEEAVRLYTRAGFAPRGPFGPYHEDPRSLFMEKRLEA